MSEKQPLHQHLPYSEAGEHNHVSMRSHLRGLAEATAKLLDYRRERIASHEQGHTPPQDLIPQDQEIVLFFPEGREE